MKRLRARLGRRRKPTAPVSVEINWQCGVGADEQFVEWLKKNIRLGGNPGVML